MKRETQFTSEYLNRLLRYDPESGLLYWRARPIEMFADDDRSAQWNCRAWNSKHVDREAGTTSRRYVTVRIARVSLRAHRVIWCMVTGKWPSHHIDHIDGDPSNNRVSNLRVVTEQQNHMNVRTHRDNLAGLKGITRTTARNGYCARIMREGKNVHLGSFNCPAAAHFAYVVAADRLHGEFARFA